MNPLWIPIIAGALFLALFAAPLMLGIAIADNHR